MPASGTPKPVPPLLHYTKRQTELLQAQFPDYPVQFGMMVGNPPVQRVVSEMIASGVDKLIALPMFPQYSATTTASAATDALFGGSPEGAARPSVASGGALLRTPGLP